VLKKALGICNKVLTIVGTTMIAFIVCTIFYQGIIRFTFSQTLKWVEEVAAPLLVAIVFLGIGIVEQNDGHVKMDLIYSSFPRAKKFLRINSSVITLLFAVVCVYCEYTYLPSVKGKTTSATSNIPLAFFHWTMLVGLIYWTFSVLCCIFLELKTYKESSLQ
jgi:TRAP-type C4-dicarboxylate transport system permease small subunit